VPAERRRARTDSGSLLDSSAIVSVISSSSASAGSPHSPRISATRSASRGFSKARAVRLTEMRRSAWNLRRQFAAVRQAVRSTQSLITSEAPLTSATGRKAAGKSSPRSGWRQRTSASAPPISPEPDRTIGW